MPAIHTRINLQPTVINLFPDEVEINGLKAVISCIVIQYLFLLLKA